MIGYGFSPRVENEKKGAQKAEKEKAYIVFHLAEGDAFKMLGGLTWRKTLIIIKGLAAALLYMHEKNIRHGDVKLANVLVTEEGIPKLCDFGSTRNMKEMDQFERPALTTGYAGRNENNPLEMTDDVYSFGICILHLLTKKPTDKKEIAYNYWVSVKKDIVAGRVDAHENLRRCRGFSEETAKVLFGLAIEITNSRGEDGFSRKGMDVIVGELEKLDVPEEDQN